MSYVQTARLWIATCLILFSTALSSCGGLSEVFDESVTDPFPWTYSGSGTMSYTGDIECSGAAELEMTLNDGGAASFTLTTHKVVATVSASTAKSISTCVDYDSSGGISGVHYVRGYDAGGAPRGDLETTQTGADLYGTYNSDSARVGGTTNATWSYSFDLGRTNKP